MKGTDLLQIMTDADKRLFPLKPYSEQELEEFHRTWNEHIDRMFSNLFSQLRQSPQALYEEPGDRGHGTSDKGDSSGP